MKMIGEITANRRKTLEQSVATEKASLTDVEGSRAARESNVVEAEAALSTRTVVFDEKIKTLADTTHAVKAANKLVEEAATKQRCLDVNLAEVGKEKIFIEKALSDNLMPLKNGGFDASAAKASVEALLLLSKCIKLDDSLQTALPSACAKQPDDRGTFERIVIDQFEEQLNQKIVELTQALAASETTKKERDMAVDVAQKNAVEATADQKRTAADLQSAKASKFEAAATLEEAKAALSDLKPEYLQATKTLSEKTGALDSFVAVNVASFDNFIAKLAPPSETEVSALAMPVEGEN